LPIFAISSLGIFLFFIAFFLNELSEVSNNIQVALKKCADTNMDCISVLFFDLFDELSMTLDIRLC
jgi:hypothetical protein